jgi:hypothetical protein
VKKKLISTLKYLIFLLIGVLLFWLAYRGQNFERLMKCISEAQWGWIVGAVALSAVGHYSRAVRWRLLLEPFGYRLKDSNLFMSVMVMYLANMGIPRSGELVRCGVVSKYEGVPFSRCFGTVVTERVADVVVLVILSIFVFATQGSIVLKLVDNNPHIMEFFDKAGGWLPWLGLSFVLISIVLLYMFRKAVRGNWFGIGDKVSGTWNNFKDGMLTILKLKKRWQFVFHSFFINFVYFYTIYMIFKAFSFTEELSAATALLLFVISTFGVVIPSPGGMGTWHFIVIEILALYGVPRDPDAGAYALVAHGAQDMMFVIVGFAALLLLPIFNRKYIPYQPDETC